MSDSSFRQVQIERSKSGLRIFNVPAALIACAPGQFTAHPDELRTALAMVAEPSGLLRRLLDGGRTVVAGRLAGGFRNIGRNEAADQILRAMRAAGHEVNESDPFNEKPRMVFGARETSPYVNRLAVEGSAALGTLSPHPRWSNNTTRNTSWSNNS